MSKHFRPWKIDETQLLPASVQDYVGKVHLSRLIVALVRGAKAEWALICTAHHLAKLARVA